MGGFFSGDGLVFDLVVVTVILVSAVMSIGRGLVREAFSVLSFVIGALVVYFCLVYLEPPLHNLIAANDKDSILPAAILVIVGFLAAYGAAAWLGGRVAKLIHASPEIGVIDRLAGAMFGAARGFLAMIVFVLLMEQVLPESATPTFIAKSRSYSYLSGAAEWIRTTVPGFVKRAQETLPQRRPD